MNATTFHNMIITEFGLTDFGSDDQLQYIDYIGELVLQGILIQSLSALDDAHAAELETLIDQEKESAEILSFLEKNIPSFTDMIKNEIVNVKKDLQKADEME
jgi:hypothetical protein